MRSLLTLAAACAVAITVAACGGGGSSSTSTTPTTPSTPATVAVNIVAISGNASFSPDPVQATAGSMVTWKNSTTTLHHIVMDDGSAVIGDIQPGATSAPIPLPGAGGTYHCTIHPSMVGSINGQVAPTPPVGSGDGY